MATKPLEIVYNAPVIKRLIGFFSDLTQEDKVFLKKVEGNDSVAKEYRKYCFGYAEDKANQLETLKEKTKEDCIKAIDVFVKENQVYISTLQCIKREQ